MRQRTLLIAIVTMLAACASTGTARVADPDDAVILRVGDTVKVADQGTLRFVAVREDSRCPPTVTCIRAGDALVDLDLMRPGRPTRRFTLRYPDEKIAILGLAKVSVDSLDFASPPRLSARLVSR